MSTRRAILSGLVALGLSLAASPAAQAVVKDAELGSFGSGHLSNPIGVAVDQASHDAYVANLLEDKLAEFDPSGSLLSPPSPFGAGVVAISGAPVYSGIALDPVDGDLYAVDAGDQTLQTYDSSTGVLLSEFPLAGSANLFGSFTVVQIATDSAGNVYVPNAPNNEVQVFSPTGGAPSGGVATTISGSGASALSAPTGVATDSAGDIFVADGGNGRVEEFSSSGAFIMAVGTGVDQSTGGNVCTAASGDTCGPGSDGTQAVAIDGAGDIYAGDDNGSGFHVVVYDPSGAELTEFGLGTIGSSAVGAINTLAVDQQTGEVYVTDGGNNVVWVYGPPLVLPDVTTCMLPTNVTATTATVGATVNPDATSLTSCRFEYGFSAAYGATASCAQSAVGSVPVTVNASLSALQPNATYHYRVVAANGNGASYGEDQTFVTPPSIPSLDDVSASAVTQTSAIIDASINPNNQVSTYRFDFGASSAYGQVLPAPDTDIGSGYGDAVVGQALSRLTPDTTYHFRVIATNATGQTTGVDETFTTLPPTPPLVSTGMASGVTQSAATLSGTVDPQGVRSTYEFDLGTDTGYGSRIFGEAGAGSGARTFTTSLSGLASATTYHYRLLATNAFGTSYGPDEIFTTPGVASSLLAAPSTAALVPAPPVASSPVSAKPAVRARLHKHVAKKPKAHRKKPNKRGARRASSKRGGNR